MKGALIALAILPMLEACGQQKGLVAGPHPNLEIALSAARECGMIDARLDPLDQQNTVLVYGDLSSPRSVRCTLRWLNVNASSLKLQRWNQG